MRLKRCLAFCTLRRTIFKRSSGSSLCVPKLAKIMVIRLDTSESSSRIEAGTIAMSGFLGKAYWLSKYSRNAPEQIASTTSLIVTPKALAIRRKRANSKDCAAKRREALTRWFKMVLGAWKLET